MNRRWVFCCLFAYSCVFADESSRPIFVLVTPRVAVATLEGASELKKSFWSAAESVWVPSVDEINAGLDLLKTPEGRARIAASAEHPDEIIPLLERWEQKRFQVYGLISQGERYIYFDAIPLVTGVERDRPALWLERSISKSTADGGSAFWCFLFDYDHRKPIKSFRRP